MGCRWCKIAVGFIIFVALTAAVAAIVSSGGGAVPVFIKFATWLGGALGIEGAAALLTFGYWLYTVLTALGVGLVYVMADVIDWILCNVCELLGSCSGCQAPTLNPRP